MTEQTPPQPRQQPRQQQPPDTQQSAPGQARHSSESGPEVFGDGSTREQQEQLVKEHEAANAETKKYADAERAARED
jgi:hypothetical protein